VERSWVRLAWGIALAAFYVGVARLGLLADAVSGFATLVWPPTGIALAALLRFGIGLWPAIAVGAFAANVWTGAPLQTAAGIALGNTLEAVAAAWTLRRLIGARDPLERVRYVIALIAVGAIASTAISATIGVASLRLGGVVAAGRFGETWRAWWLGDAIGDLVAAPLLLAFAYGGVGRPLRARVVVEAVGVAAALIAVGLFVLGGRARASPLQHAYLIFPVLIWAALRFGPRGATVATFTLSAIAIWGTARGAGPFVGDTWAGRLLQLQAFMAVVAVVGLLLAAAVAERDRAIHARDDVLAIVSHDLRNPLSAMRISARLLQKKLRDPAAPNGGKKQLAVIDRAIEQMLALVRDLLDIAAIDSGRLSIVSTRQVARRLVEETVEVMQPLAAARAQSIVAAPGGAGVEVLCDRQRVQQVLSNLIGNAIQFTPDGGTITVEVDERGAVARFSVRDRGPGIDPVELRHLFDRFWRGRSAKQVAGYGLGLFIAKGIVEAHGGAIWAEPAAGGDGSDFCFTLPLAPPATSS
jgi:signal transduction histidine kinase